MALAWHIYFTTYGTWLHGDERGSRDRHGFVQPDEVIKQRRSELLEQPPFVLNDEMRSVVETAIREACEYRDWKLYAINVRTNHVHIVVNHVDEWWRILKVVKARSTRELRESGKISHDRKVWTARGGHKAIETEESLRRVVLYVNNAQDWKSWY